MKNTAKYILIMTIVAIAQPAAGQSANPLLQEWNTPHQTPPFSKIRNEHYAPAVKEAIKEAEGNIKRIIRQKEAPTFENTIVALQTASERLDRQPGRRKEPFRQCPECQDLYLGSPGSRTRSG